MFLGLIEEFGMSKQELLAARGRWYALQFGARTALASEIIQPGPRAGGAGDSPLINGANGRGVASPFSRPSSRAPCLVGISDVNHGADAPWLDP
ncbi:hypothetical protein QN224_15845 [Sinorhizobium sp. 8-89]|uniref:hypothetical protein n=1 Tax=Sinorhizobium sp. 7-81 TaxID=3049087 RepID=UPI0024C3D08B|nr:hypothetical protein [Sinorhizobium sp. 7-81]MDK1386882.1 hypothetical protein [Sinorhizobium sp. 7-81]